MIDGVSSSNTAALSAMAQQAKETSLTDEQKSELESIISKYDASTATEEDMQALFSELEEAGIGPSKEVGAALNAAGFAPPAGPGGPPPMGGVEDEEEDDEDDEDILTIDSLESEIVQEFAEKFISGEYEEEDLDAIAEDLAEDPRALPAGTFVDEEA